MLARKRAIAAIISSVERGFFALAVLEVVVLFTPVANPFVVRDTELDAFKAPLLTLVVVLVVVVVVFMVRGL